MILTEKTAQDCFYLWAKTDRKSGSWHPLIFHALDTLAVAEELWDKILSPNERTLFATQLEIPEETAKTWICFLAALHDIGKASPPFLFLRAAPDFIKNRFKALGLREKPGDNYHHGEATAAILSSLLPQILRTPDSTSNKIAPFLQDLSQALGGHHGTFPDETSLFDRRESMAPSVEHPLWRELRLDLVNTLRETSEVNLHSLAETIAAGKNLSPSAWILFAGFVTVADWLASNEEFFPYCEDQDLPCDQYLNRARVQAQEALENIGWSGWEAPTNALPFEKLFPDLGAKVSPRPVQKWALTALADIRLAIIEAPMGEGKTEAALILLERLIAGNHLRGGYFALPTMATSNQMFGRVGTFLGNWCPDIRINFHLLHGKALFSDTYQALQHHAVGQDEDEGDIVADDWFRRPKRGLLSPFAVGTVDQSLLACLKTRHFFVRLFGLADKVLIFDEVHAYDTYMLTLFENLLTWLSSLGTRVIILSATLPSSTREKLFRAYAGEPSLTLPVATYPRITWLGGNNTVKVQPFKASLTPTYKLEWRKNHVSERASELENLLEIGGKALWICNTVRKAQEVYGELKDRLGPKGIEVSLFHARFPLKQRLEIEERTLTTFGKDPEYPEKSRILVATQVVEQSLDLDFDLMISELAPIDLILQRLGRLHRHVRPRPKNMETPLMLLLEPEIGEDGLPNVSRSVYDEYILLRSWRTLRNITSIALPKDMDRLIQSVYGEEVKTEMEVNFCQKLDCARKNSAEKKASHADKGKGVVIKKPGKRSVLEAFDFQLGEDNPEANPALRAQTRLSGPSVNIVCLHKIGEKICLDAEGKHVVDSSSPPETREEILALLKNAFSLSFPSVLKLFPPDLVPREWKRSSLLRYHRRVIFDGGRFETSNGEMILFLDQEKGLISQWKGAKKNENNLQSDQ